MDQSRKFDLVIEEIQKARKKHSGDFIPLKLSPEGVLNGLPRKEVLEILEDFQRREKVVELSESNYPINRPDRKVVAYGIDDPETGERRWVSPEEFAKQATAQETDAPNPEAEALLEAYRNSVRLTVLSGFDNWFAAYQLKKQDDLESLSPINLAKIYCTVLDMDEKLQMKASPVISVNLFFHHVTPLLGENFPYSTYRTDALDYLKNKGVVSGYKMQFAYSDLKITGGYVDITVNIPQFQKFKPRILQFYQAKEKKFLPPETSPQPASESKGPAPQDSDVVYEVKYPQGRTILVNGSILANPDFDGENDNVFGYLYKNPNKKIDTKELEEKCLGGVPLKKDLHKIVENLGFTGCLRQLFFDVSKTSIRFRNPIRVKDLKEMGIDWLRPQR